MGRCKNADDDSVFEEEEDGGQLLYNLYAYSNNNPVNMEDSEGDIAWIAVQALFAAPDIYKAIKNPSLKNFKNVATNFIPFAKVGKMGFKTFKVTKKMNTAVKSKQKMKVTKKTLYSPIKTYRSLKTSNNYNKAFKAYKIKTADVNNSSLLKQLNKIGSGWVKIYHNGYLNGKKVSYHYFRDRSGKVYDVKLKKWWS